MTGLFEKQAGTRWRRSQRFRLSAKGAEAQESYRKMLLETREVTGGRSKFDAARTAWAAPLALQPSDGLYLGELEAGPRTIEEVVQALDSCGSTRKEVKSAVDRLASVGMIEPI